MTLTELLEMSEAPLVVSACLAGLPCRYDGKSKPVEAIRKLVEQGRAVAVCPEQLGGLPTPRPASGIRRCQNCPDRAEGGSDLNVGEAVWRGQAELVNREGRDVTDFYRRGAQLALEKARSVGAQAVVFKQHSPSCGVGSTGGADPWQRVAGDGVTAALFKQAGFMVVSDESIGAAN